MIELKYKGLIKAWKFEWGALYLWKAARESQFGRYEYVYLTVYIKSRSKGWLQRTVYLGRADEIAKRLTAPTPQAP